jgi:CheY-like chemotaxis protein
MWVKDGVEALDFIHCTGEYASRQPHVSLKLVLLDLKMPRMSGLDVLRALKADENTAMLPVVVMTASNQDRDIMESYQLGVNGYVTKPMHFETFMQQVTNIGLYWLTANLSPSQMGSHGVLRD